MADAHRLPREALTAIAAQVGAFISHRPDGDRSWWTATAGERALPVLGESFQIWALGPSAAHSIRHGLRGIHPDQRLIEFMENTGHWHHQVRTRGGKAVAFVHSLRSIDKRRRERWTVEAVRASPVAPAIDRAIERIDQAEAEKPRPGLVRLLVIPGFSIHALWLEAPDGDRVLVAHQGKGRSKLSAGRFYGGYEFLAALARRAGTGTGVAAEEASRALPKTRPKKQPPRSPRGKARRR